MKTCCPSCQTIFRVTSEQIRVRAGKVRCGQCRTVFNAIDRLLDEDDSLVAIQSTPQAVTGSEGVTAVPIAAASPGYEEERIALSEAEVALPGESEGAPAGESDPSLPDSSQGESLPASGEQALVARPLQGGEAETPDLPRETSVSTGDSRWLEGMTNKPALPADRSVTRPFAIVASVLAVALVGQMVFHFRSAIAINAPALRPVLEALSDALGTDMPLPRQAELVSIEGSDLQTDAVRNKLLALQATLRNRAPYAQAYPALELTLTDTNDKAVARRVWLPEEYLPPASLEERSFAANSDLDVRLWLEAREINAAGYRLYVFYP